MYGEPLKTEPELAADIGKIIKDHGIAALLKGITEHCSSEYERRRDALHALKEAKYGAKRWNMDGDKYPVELRREEDESYAVLFVNLDHIQQSYEERMARAGLTRKEKCALDKQAEVEKLERQLTSVKERKCA